MIIKNISPEEKDSKGDSLPSGSEQDISQWINENLSFGIDELPNKVASSFSLEAEEDSCEQIVARIDFINDCLKETIKGSEAKIEEIVNLFYEWMTKHSVVRLVGVGRAKIAGNISMYRLAHGGARTFINDGNIPLPNSIHGGGIIAVSASGKTEIILEILKQAYVKEDPNMTIVAIAAEEVRDYYEKNCCHHFIGIKKDVKNSNNSLTALADVEEQIICQLLDAMVVAAGKKAFYDDTQWRIEHEDVGATGPYGVKL